MNFREKDLVLAGLLCFSLNNIQAQCKVGNLKCAVNQQICTDIRDLKLRLVGVDYQRLFIGGEGNGKRSIVHAMAKEANAFLIELHSSDLVKEYAKEGCTYFKKTLFASSAADAKRNNQDVVVLYVSNVDEVDRSNRSEQKLSHDSTMQDSRAAFAAFRDEWEKYNNDIKNDIKIFVIFGAKSESTIHSSFIEKLKGFIVTFPNPDWHKRVEIFNKYIFQQDVREAIMKKIDSINANGIAQLKQEIESIAKLENENAKLWDKFWTEFEINKKSWCEQATFALAKQDLVDDLGKLIAACKTIQDEWERKQINGNLDKQVVSLAIQYFQTLKRCYSNHLFMVQNAQLFLNIYSKTAVIYPCRFMEQLAKNMLQAAINENNGILNEQIFNRYLNRIKQYDPVGDGMLTILLVNKEMNEMRREFGI